jgi:hypothetical protein
MENQIENSAREYLSMPWQNLLTAAEKNAAIIADEVLADVLLGKSVVSAVSAYFAQVDQMNLMRDRFATADRACQNVRARVPVVMRAVAGDHEWDEDDLKAADKELWESLSRAIADAAECNRKRVEAKSKESELYDDTIGVIGLCCSIASQRHRDEFICEGDTFCAAYIAALSVMDKVIGRHTREKGMKVLIDFLQYSLGMRPRPRGSDIYASSKTVAAIGTAMGIEDPNGLRELLMEALTQSATQSSRLQAHMAPEAAR